MIVFGYQETRRHHAEPRERTIEPETPSYSRQAKARVISHHLKVAAEAELAWQTSRA